MYDYYLKFDLDNRFEQTVIPYSPFRMMQERGCIFLHSEFIQGSDECARKTYPSAYRTADHWAREYHTILASNSSLWFQFKKGFFFGNFISGWLGWLRSEENRSLMHYLYQDETIAGYFQHRWTDQPIWLLMLGTFYSLTDEEVIGGISPLICDLSQWKRSGLFVHSK